jgi:NitT/TauT family transport system ATP-binding protein
MITIKNLSVCYDELCVLNHFSYTFEEHKIISLVGPSGCGKTTLLNAISGLVEYDGLIEVSSRLSYIFQEDRLLPWASVEENIRIVLENVIAAESIDEHVKKYLELVGLSSVMHQKPASLSGGMKRRVSIARAFAYPSEVLLMDEPFKGLDKQLKLEIMKDVKAIWEHDKRTVIMITHDEEEAHYFSDKVLYLNGLPLEIHDEKHI